MGGGLIEVFKWIKGINKADIKLVLNLSLQENSIKRSFKLDKLRCVIGNRSALVLVTELSMSGTDYPSRIITVSTLASLKYRPDRHISEPGWV